MYFKIFTIFLQQILLQHILLQQINTSFVYLRAKKKILTTTTSFQNSDLVVCLTTFMF